MTITNIREIFLVLIISFLLLCLLNPYEFWMPTSLHVLVIVVLLIVFTTYATFLFKEQSSDEREAILRMNAGRVAYFVGTTIIVSGIVVQSFQHAVDYWLVASIVGMTLAKIASRVYLEKHH